MDRPTVTGLAPEAGTVRAADQARRSSATRAARRGATFVGVAALLVAAALSQADGLVRGIVAYERDTPVFYYPLFAWASQQLRAGHFPLWAPQVFGGYPIFADGEIGLASPTVVLSLLALPPDRAFVLLRVLHLAIAGLGAFLLARTWHLPVGPATLAGITFALGSFLQAQIHHENIVRTAAWLPLVLAAAEAALRTRGRRRLGWIALGSLGLGMASVGLHAQILAIDLLAIAAYGLARWWAGPIAGAAGDVVRRLGALVVVFPALAALGIALGGVQLVPLAELARFSPRGSGLSFSEAAAYSLTPFGLPQLILPFWFRGPGDQQWGLWTHWESYLYVGLVPLTLAAVAVARVRRREVWAWTAFVVLSVILALGQYSPLDLYALVWELPGMAGLRAPGRFALPAVLGLAMLAAYGLAWLERNARAAGAARPGLWRVTLAAAPAVVVAAVLFGAHRWLLTSPDAAQAAIDATYLTLPRDSYPLSTSTVYSGLLWATDVENQRTAVAVLGLLGTGIALWLWQASPWMRLRRWPGWSPLLLAGAAADLLVFGWSVHPRDSLANLSAAPPAAQVVRRLMAQDRAAGPARVLTSPALEAMAPNRLAPLSIQEASGYTSLESRWHQEYLRRVRSVDDDLLDLWNVRYLLEPARYGSLASYRGVDFLPPSALLRGPSGSALADESFRLPPDFDLAELRLVTALVHAESIPQDTAVAELLLRDDRGAILARRTLRAGRDSMEWSWDERGAGGVQHQRVEVAGLTFEAQAGRPPASRQLSFARLAFDPPLRATRLEVRATLPQGEFVLYGAALVDPRGSTRQLFGRHKWKYREVYRDAQVAVIENAAAYPRAFLVPRALLAPTAGGALDAMAHQPFDPRREVVLSASRSDCGAGGPASVTRPSRAPPSSACLAGLSSPTLVAQAMGTSDVPPSLPNSSPGTATVERYESTDVSVRVSTPSEALLVLSDNYYPGWRVLVDGREQPLLRGDLLFRAVQVPAGSHSVEFRFEPTSVWLGLGVSGGALAAAAAMLALAGWPRRREAPGR